MTDTRDYGDSETYYSGDDASSLEEDNKKTVVKYVPKKGLLK